MTGNQEIQSKKKKKRKKKKDDTLKKICDLWFHKGKKDAM